MNNCYVNEKGYLCILKNTSEAVYDNNNIILGFIDGRKEIKYKVNKDGLFEEIIENN